MATDTTADDLTLADAPTVDADTLQRDLDTLRDAAEIIYPGIGAMLYDWWASINEDHFGRQMTPPGIQFGLTPHGSKMGLWRGWEETIILHRSLIDPSGDAWGKRHQLGHRYAWDVLLHEMIHQYVDTVREVEDPEGNSPSNSVHNCPSWVREINRLSNDLGLDCEASVIRQKRVDGSVQWCVPDGHLTMAELGSWPHSVRPDGYYRNDPNPAFELDDSS